MTNNSMLKKIGVASFIMMASIFASRVIGVFRLAAIGGIGGVSASVDAYQIAFIIPEILNHVVASGYLSITFIPIFSKYLAKNDEENGYRVYSIIMNTFGLALLCFILITIIWAPTLVKLFAPGIQNPETFAQAVRMTRIIIPAQFFFFSGGLLMAIQFTKENFLIPALAPLIYNLSIICGGLILGPYLGMEGFAWGALVGAFLGNFVLQLIGAKKNDAKYYLLFSFTHPDLIKFVLLSLPFMIGITMTFSTEIFLKSFGSFLSTGSIAAIDYAYRVMLILVAFFGQAVGVASYPYMAKLAQKGDLNELNSLLNNILKYIFIIIPFSILFIVLNYEVITILFQRNAFDINATHRTAQILPFFMVGAFAFSAQTIVSRGYYATQNTIFPAILSTVCVIISLPFIYFCMRLLGAKGVALGFSVSVIIQCLLLFETWNKKSMNTGKSGVYLFLFKMIITSITLYIFLYPSVLVLRDYFESSKFLGAFSIAIILGIEFIILLFCIGKLFKIEEIQLFYKKISDKGRLKK